MDILILIFSGSLYLISHNTYDRHFRGEQLKREKKEDDLVSEDIDNKRRTTEGAISTHSELCDINQRNENRKRQRHKFVEIAKYLSESIFMVLLMCAGILEPSLLSAPYFIIFLFICTWIACNQTFGPKYQKFKLVIAIYIGLHFTALFLYQMDFFRNWLPSDTLEAR